MSSTAEIVRRHFDADAARFDAIYTQAKPLGQRLADRLFRGVVVERLRLARNLAPSTGAWTVLDVGCGSGRFSVALALEGAARVVGIDGAPAMIEIARQAAASAGLADRCAFVTEEYLAWSSAEQFDVVVATGYFDYLDQPLAHLSKMLRQCRGRLFASFPKRWEVRVPTRKLRFAVRGSFVRFYGRAEVRQLFAAAGVAAERVSVLDLGRDWFVVARP